MTVVMPSDSPCHSFGGRDEAQEAEERVAAEKVAKRDPNARLGLPPPDPSKRRGPRVELGGTGVALDALGPLVIHKDGTASRIEGWAAKPEAEKQKVLRVLGKRNRERTQKITARGGKVTTSDTKGRALNPHRQAPSAGSPDL